MRKHILTSIPTEKVAIREAADVVQARGTARQMASRIGFGLADQTRLATAVSELARNVVQYAGEGECLLVDASNAEAMSLCIVVEDHGLGIADIDQAMLDGFSTGGGLGAGLPGTRRLMDEFAIVSEPGCTRVSIALTRKRG